MQMVVAGDDRPVPTASALVFEAFYDAEYPALLKLAYVLTGSRPVAEELVQEAMLRAYRHWAKVARYDKPGAWARRVVVNLATSRGRRLTAEARALVKFRNRHDSATQPRVESAELWRELRKLPARQSRALALFYVEDLSVSEIASLLECPEGTVKALLHRGRATLAHALGDSDEEERS
jgi:RNA polymerase sigma-70 factor (ECF subfamily)